MLNANSSIPEPGDAAHAAGVNRLIRRICLLREQGMVAEAARLEREDLAMAVRRLRDNPAGAGFPEDVVKGLFAREESRAADAVALAEFLVPQLLAHWPPRSPAAVAGPVPPSLPPVPRAPGTGSPAISDLLDAMLAAERSNRRPLARVTREARTTDH